MTRTVKEREEIPMGELLSRGHECEPPAWPGQAGLQAGAVWRCDCRRVWLLRRIPGVGLRWSQMDPLVAILRGLTNATKKGD